MSEPITNKPKNEYEYEYTFKERIIDVVEFITNIPWEIKWRVCMFYRNVRRLCSWIPIIWTDRDWDSCYLLIIIRHKLQTIHDNSKDWNWVGSEKATEQLQQCIKDIDVILDDDPYSLTKQEHKQFVDKYGQEIRSVKPRAVIDLSGHDIVYLYNRMIVDFSEGKDMTDSLYLLNPTPLNVNGTVTLHNPSTFIIGPSSSPMYLIVNRKSDNSLGIFINDINARYASTGARFPGVLPIEATEEHLIVNIPSHSEKIMFDYDGEDVTAQLVPSDGKIKIHEMGMGTKTFTVPPDTFIFPIICTGSLSDCTLSFATDIPDSSLKYTIINRDGYGAGQGMIYPGGSVSTGNGRTFDWFFFRDYERKGGTFTLTVQ